MSSDERYVWLKYEIEQVAKVEIPALRWARLQELVSILNNTPTDPCVARVLQEQAG